MHIETSTDVCSVAVSQDGATIFRVEDFEGPSHAQKLGTFVDEALSFTDNHATQYTPQDLRFTVKGNDFYAIALEWSDKDITISSLSK
mgnify:CR=1 FL=1